LRDRLRNFFLHRQNVRKLAIVPIPPEFRTISEIDEVRLNDERIAHLLQPPGQHCVYRELASEPLKISLLTFEAKRSGSRDNPQLWYLRKAIDQAVRDAVGKVLRVRVCAGVDERQDNKRLDPSGGV